jgi:hypothetical protein
MYIQFPVQMPCGITMASMVSARFPSVPQVINFPLMSMILGLIHCRIVIHGFIDGHSCLITGLRASDNNLSATVLNLFLHTANIYGVPSCLRGDHGTENLGVANWMEEHRGTCRGSYIWGRFISFHVFLELGF